VSPDDNGDLYRIQTRLLEKTEIPSGSLAKAEDGYRVVLGLNNPTKQDLNVYLQWDLPDRRWQISPGRGILVGLKAGSREQAVELHMKRTDGSPPEGWPLCRIRTPYLTSNGDWVSVEHELRITDDTPAP
jgi:hypothetical protein